MAAPAALLAVKAAVAVAADKRGRNVLASIVAAVLVPFVLVIIMLLSIMDGTSSHNVSAVDLVFRDGVISSQVPEEYRKYIVDMRTSFTSLEDVIAEIDHVEDGELDTERIKSVFYAMYFGSAQPSLLAQKEFVDCFVEYEEREDEDGDAYTAAIPITDFSTVYANIRQRLGLEIGAEQEANAQRIYTVAAYGPAVPGGMMAGAAMGDGSYQALFAEASKYIGFPYRWGGSSPQTSFDCSGYICWIYTQSGAYQLPRTSAQGIFDQCAVIPREEAKPGDLVFFTKTYASSTPVSHVGLYVGGNQMLHCGDPIGYANIDSSYWRSHFYAFARLPAA